MKRHRRNLPLWILRVLRGNHEEPDPDYLPIDEIVGPHRSSRRLFIEEPRVVTSEDMVVQTESKSQKKGKTSFEKYGFISHGDWNDFIIRMTSMEAKEISESYQKLSKKNTLRPNLGPGGYQAKECARVQIVKAEENYFSCDLDYPDEDEGIDTLADVVNHFILWP
ncbi:hypothetical protein PR202_ga27676 [Eleusine coracana subsp. coracana]|uniref:Uncharacterized protein n=1 Tax=Eleusine coracana subsp. coracana TaxID=191504 RepID=A0AAV5DHK9_ELECO|nr:hypothetical protein PR202_ga27676 [Eleusine coracana subsp. coracana]